MKLLSIQSIFWSLLLSLLVFACSDDEDSATPTTDDPIASFQFAVDANDFLKVNFSNFSQNADSYSWDFGDGNTSTEKDPSHTYSSSGEYTVTLTATSGSKSAEFSDEITITDPQEAFKLLTGETSKTWKLYREGTSMSLGPDADNPEQYWSGLMNDGTRPCLYEQEFTFNFDGSYVFNDNGMFWAEFGVFNNVEGCDMNITAESCFDATAGNMVNACGEDVSSWLSGTHAFSYDPSTGDLTLTGQGAWIGIPKLSSTGQVTGPQASVTAKISIEQFTGYDVLLVEFIYGNEYWPIRYASYSDASLEPALVTDATPFGEDLPDVSPADMSHSFASNDAGDWVLLDTITSGSNVEFGVDDPADAGAAKVGQFNRTDARFQELQFQTAPDKLDINFENLTSVSIDVYLPSTNDYAAGISKQVIIGFGDVSQTEQWWTDLMQYENDGSALPLDEWTTVTFDLSSPSWIANAENGSSPYDRNDFDMIFLNVGGSDHEVPGTFYVRNLRFE